MLLNDQKCMNQTNQTINLHPNKYIQDLYYYPFAVKLDRCVVSFNTCNDLSNKVCVPNKRKDFFLRLFSMITGKKLIDNMRKSYIMQM